MPELVPWRPLFQQTIDRYYAGELDEGREACERLLSLDGLTEQFHTQAVRNCAFYAPFLSEWVPDLTFRPIEVPVSEGWSRFNPSICADGDGFRMILRSSNYVVGNQLDYHVLHPDGVFRNVSRLLTLDNALRVQSVEVIDDSEPIASPSAFPVLGLEDCRLIPDDGGWSVIATTRQHSPGGWCQQALMRLDGATLRDLRLLSSPDRHEKNWMPIVGMPGPSFVYLCSPTIVVRATGGDPGVETVVSHPGPRLAAGFRGGTHAVQFDGGHLCLIHEAANYEGGGRVYLHRFVWFDAEWNLARCSHPFLLRERGIEFAAGLAIQGERAVISFGVWDRDAYLAELPLAAIRPLLLTLPADGIAVAEPAAAPLESGEEVGITPFPEEPVEVAATTMEVDGNQVRVPEPDDRERSEGVAGLSGEADDWYARGDLLAQEGEHEEAIAAFERCWSLPGSDEQAAVAMYRAATSWLTLGEPERAVEACAAGMTRHAGVAELPWLAAYASWQLPQPLQAANWARIAVALGVPYGQARIEERVRFEYLPALYEGPFDVLRYALRALGDETGALEAELRFREALAMRERGQTAQPRGESAANGRDLDADPSADLLRVAGEAARAAHAT